MTTLYLDSTHPHSLTLYVTVQPGYSSEIHFQCFPRKKKYPTGLEWCEDEQVIISGQTGFKICPWRHFPFCKNRIGTDVPLKFRRKVLDRCIQIQHFNRDPGSSVNKSAQNPTGSHHSTQLELSKTHTWIKQRNAGMKNKKAGGLPNLTYSCHALISSFSVYSCINKHIFLV